MMSLAPGWRLGSPTTSMAAEVRPPPTACQLAFQERQYACFAPAAAPYLQAAMPFPALDPSAAVHGALDLSLSQVILFSCVKIGQCPISASLSYVYGALHGGPGVPASDDPPFVLVGEGFIRTGRRTVRLTRIATTSTSGTVGGPATTVTAHGPWTFRADLPRRHMRLTLEADARRGVVRTLGMDLVEVARR